MISEQATKYHYDQCISVLKKIHGNATTEGARPANATLALTVSGITGQALAYGTVLGLTPEQIEQDIKNNMETHILP